MSAHRSLALLLCLSFLLLVVACSPSEEAVQEAVQAALAATQEAQPSPTVVPTVVPTVEPLSDLYRTAINDYMLSASRLNAATAQGVTYFYYKDYYAEAGGLYELALASWPDDFATDAKERLSRAMLGWDLAAYLWETKISEAPDPIRHIEGPLAGTEDGRFTELENYAGEYLEAIEITNPKSKRYLADDTNIQILLELASRDFESGRDLLLPLLK